MTTPEVQPRTKSNGKEEASPATNESPSCAPAGRDRKGRLRFHRVSSRNYGREPRSRLYCPVTRRSYREPDAHSPGSAVCQGCGVGFPGFPLQTNPFHDKERCEEAVCHV
jgi:hypothetical protein